MSCNILVTAAEDCPPTCTPSPLPSPEIRLFCHTLSNFIQYPPQTGDNGIGGGQGAFAGTASLTPATAADLPTQSAGAGGFIITQTSVRIVTLSSSPSTVSADGSTTGKVSMTSFSSPSSTKTATFLPFGTPKATFTTPTSNSPTAMPASPTTAGAASAATPSPRHKTFIQTTAGWVTIYLVAMFLLLAAILGIWLWMRRKKHRKVKQQGLEGVRGDDADEAALRRDVGDWEGVAGNGNHEGNAANPPPPVPVTIAGPEYRASPPRIKKISGGGGGSQRRPNTTTTTTPTPTAATKHLTAPPPPPNQPSTSTSRQTGIFNSTQRPNPAASILEWESTHATSGLPSTTFEEDDVEAAADRLANAARAHRLKLEADATQATQEVKDSWDFRKNITTGPPRPPFKVSLGIGPRALRREVVEEEGKDGDNDKHDEDRGKGKSKEKAREVSSTMQFSTQEQRDRETSILAMMDLTAPRFKGQDFDPRSSPSSAQGPSATPPPPPPIPMRSIHRPISPTSTSPISPSPISIPLKPDGDGNGDEEELSRRKAWMAENRAARARARARAATATATAAASSSPSADPSPDSPSPPKAAVPIRRNSLGHRMANSIPDMETLQDLRVEWGPAGPVVVGNPLKGLPVDLGSLGRRALRIDTGRWEREFWEREAREGREKDGGLERDGMKGDEGKMDGEKDGSGEMDGREGKDGSGDQDGKGKGKGKGKPRK